MVLFMVCRVILMLHLREVQVVRGDSGHKRQRTCSTKDLGYRAARPEEKKTATEKTNGHREGGHEDGWWLSGHNKE